MSESVFASGCPKKQVLCILDSLGWVRSANDTIVIFCWMVLASHSNQRIAILLFNFRGVKILHLLLGAICLLEYILLK